MRCLKVRPTDSGSVTLTQEVLASLSLTAPQPEGLPASSRAGSRRGRTGQWAHGHKPGPGKLRLCMWPEWLCSRCGLGSITHGRVLSSPMTGLAPTRVGSPCFPTAVRSAASSAITPIPTGRLTQAQGSSPQMDRWTMGGNRQALPTLAWR